MRRGVGLDRPAVAARERGRPRSQIARWPLREEIKRKNEGMQEMVEGMFSELSNVKTDRNLLAGLFVEIAKCLNQDMGTKGVGKTGVEPMRGSSAG